MWLPPATTFHVGCAVSESSPWLSKKRISVSAGNERIASSDADQIADAMGSRYRSRERLAEAARLEEVAERLALGIRRAEQRRRFAIEAHDLAEQGQVRRR